MLFRSTMGHVASSFSLPHEIKIQILTGHQFGTFRTPFFGRFAVSRLRGNIASDPPLRLQLLPEELWPVGRDLVAQLGP